MRLPDRVTIIEVGLRDGLQSESRFVPTDRKVALANAVAKSGIPLVELTSFVHPKVIPQLADAEQVVAGFDRSAGAACAALVPNRKGAERALAAQVDELHCVIMCSESFNQRNVHMTVQESLRQAGEVAALCAGAGRPVRRVAGLGTAFGCPYEGDVPQSRVLGLVAELVPLGFSGIALADTTGMANPVQVARLAANILDRWPDLEVTLHFHNTRGMGLANVVGGLEAGVTRYEASLGGLGGCPFAPRATGNICTEDTVHMLHEMGITTGVNLDQLVSVAQQLEEVIGRELPGQILRAGPRGQRYPVG